MSPRPLREKPGIGDVPSVDAVAEVAHALPPIVDASEFLTAEITPPRELVWGILHQGSKMVLGGGSKTFKTWTLLDLAVSVATGEPWLSFKTVRGRVLFLNLEIQPAFFQRRLRAVAKEKSILLTKGQIDVWNLRGRASSYHLLLPQINERVKASEYALIVLDPIYKLYGDTDENSAGAVARLLNAVESLAVESGAAIAFGAHYSKGNQAGKEAIDRISGSGVFARDPDSILNFTSHEERDCFVVEATLRNFRPTEPFVVRWLYPLMRRDESLDATKLKMARGRPKVHTVEKILECLKGERLESRKWLERASLGYGISKAKFYELLKEAKKLPQVKKTPEGQWYYDKRAGGDVAS
ncbi:MAG TPA: AAA family ATPase [Verrucomicrobiae bacterium]|nr:AAA family ATPase [Verrucomicrobiae bacterium]